MAESSASPDISAALAQVMPRLRATRTTAQMLLVVIAILTAVAAVSLRGRMGDDLDWLFFPAFAGFMLAALVFAQTSRSHDKNVMPHLAGAIGLDYSKGAGAFLKDLPPRLLPDRVRSAEDLLSGNVAGRSVQFAEVKVETGGKNSRTIFDGYVIRVPNLVPMPPFFLAPADEFESGFLRRANLSSDGLFRIGTEAIHGISFTLWTSSAEQTEDAGFTAVVDALKGMGPILGGGASLYSVTSDREVMHLAVRHVRNLFTIGGVFSSEEAVMASARTALEDLSLPVRITGAILDAEAQVAKRRAEA